MFEITFKRDAEFYRRNRMAARLFY